MKYLLIILVLLFASASAFTPSLFSPEQRVTSEDLVPDPFSLLGEWWSYVDIGHVNLSERVEYVKNNTKKSIESANPEFKRELISANKCLIRWPCHGIASGFVKPDNRIKIEMLLR